MAQNKVRIWNGVTDLHICESGYIGAGMLYYNGAGCPIPVSVTNKLPCDTNINFSPSGSLYVSGFLDFLDPLGAASLALVDGDKHQQVDVLEQCAVRQSGVWSINNISGTISLPTDASTETTLQYVNTLLSGVATQSTLSSINTNVKYVDTTNIVVSGALPAGTNIVGKVLQGETWSINNISGTVSLPTGASTDATLKNISGVIATETTLSALNTKVTTCNTQAVSGVVRVMDNGGSLTVDGEVSANILGGPVYISGALPAGTAAIGKLAANTGVTIGNVGLVGGPVYISGAIAAGTNTIGSIKITNGTNTAGVDSSGFLGIREYGIPYQTPVVSGWFTTDATTAVTVVPTPGASLSLYVTDIVVSTSGATSVSLLDNTITRYKLHLGTNGGWNSNFRTPWKLSSNSPLKMSSITATDLTCTMNGFVAP